MICMHHTIKVLNADGSKETITSTLVNYGVKGGNTSMARTVTIPVAIAISKILSGEITNTGVVRPTTADIYVPILKEMSDKVYDRLKSSLYSPLSVVHLHIHQCFSVYVLRA